MPGVEERPDLPMHDPGVFGVMDDRPETYPHIPMLSGGSVVTGCVA
ncbi:hypothetical protein [Planomonospora algeriensis]